MKINGAILIFFLFPLLVLAQEVAPQPPGIFADSLLNHLTGEWKMRGQVMGDSVEYICSAKWVLNHRFLRWHLKDVNQPPAYEALVFIGFDQQKNQYVAHWLDVFGGGASRTVGYGTRNGNAIELLFNYPESPFWDVLTFHPQSESWTFVIQQKDRQGLWQNFASYRLTRTE